MCPKLPRIAGLIRANVFHTSPNIEGKTCILKNASDFFWSDEYETYNWSAISDQIYEVLKMILPPRESPYHWQFDFGGDGYDGLIDYCLPEKIKSLPDIEFVIGSIIYRMRFNVKNHESFEV